MGYNKHYHVVCEDCGIIEFDVLDQSTFSNEYAALWYAGYHSGQEHPDSECMMAFPEPVTEMEDDR